MIETKELTILASSESDRCLEASIKLLSKDKGVASAVRRLSKVGDQLGGTILDQLEAALNATVTGQWDVAVEMFSRQKGASHNLYIGPFKASEGGEVSDGLIYMQRRTEMDDLVALVEGLSDQIGELLFNTPASFYGREIELYDLVKSYGEFQKSNGRAIALFTPFYLSGHKNISPDPATRRSILFVNVVRNRFVRLTKPLIRDCLFDDQTPLAASASDIELDRALSLWLILHELMHGSGPMPLFVAPSFKIELGMSYAGVEEARVDATVWLVVKMLETVFGDTARLAAELIVLERVFRSARIGLKKYGLSGGILRDSDCENGAFIVEMVARAGCLGQDNILRVDTQLLELEFKTFVRQVLAKEATARSDSDAPSQVLSDAADSLRKSYFNDIDGCPVYHETTRAFFDSILNFASYDD